jgi:nucleoside-diphosphate-sugar epimerase
MIAILGATGYIGRSLARTIAIDHETPLVLFARDPAALANESWPAHVRIQSLADFQAGHFELVINAIGAGDPVRVAKLDVEILSVTQAWDERVLATMGQRTRYVFLSSGAVHKTTPDQSDAEGAIPSYTLSKRQAEIRHRAMVERPILDIRIFGYADASINQNGTFFLAELARSVATRQPFATTSQDMIRDYAGARELHALINCWGASDPVNHALDLYTKAPLSKLKLLDVVAARYGLNIDYSRSINAGPSGAKAVYAPVSRAAAALGYVPARDSTQIVLDTLDAIASV